MKREFKLDNNAISRVIAEHIGKAIADALAPINILTYAVSQYGCPVMTYNNPFDPHGKDVKDVCYGVYIDTHADVCGTTTPKVVGKLVALLKCDSGEVNDAYAEDFVDFFSADFDEYEKNCESFARHFLNAVGCDYDAAKEEIRKSVITELAKAIPYAEMITAYPKSEVGEYHETYDGQNYVEECRCSAEGENDD